VWYLPFDVYFILCITICPVEHNFTFA
jgi:hypothetical protein